MDVVSQYIWSQGPSHNAMKYAWVHYWLYLDDGDVEESKTLATLGEVRQEVRRSMALRSVRPRVQDCRDAQVLAEVRSLKESLIAGRLAEGEASEGQPGSGRTIKDLEGQLRQQQQFLAAKVIEVEKSTSRAHLAEAMSEEFQGALEAAEEENLKLQKELKKLKLENRILKMREQKDMQTKESSEDSCCFMLDELFQMHGGTFLSSQHLFAGAHVVAADGSFLRVACAPAIQMAADSVILEADGDPWRWTREDPIAKLQVTPDHRIPCASGEIVRACRLQPGDTVMVNGEEAKLTKVQMVPGPVQCVKIIFDSDKAVGSFAAPPSIWSHGGQQKKTRRGGEKYQKAKGSKGSKDGGDDTRSIPDTKCEYSD
ncbi:Uncharacterized protein SCF082_LOCUS32924 [Durusdinium trenchii]|uniref:Hedgehog protein Hint domain-containing protein n=1 Tax=Durusdinium trenchii TaxID=1381693 RepID=A0ABP0NIP0_9DINO